MILVDSLSLTWDLPDPFVAEVMVKTQHIDALAHTNNGSYIAWCEDISWIHSQVLGAGIDAFLDSGAGMAIYHSEWNYLAPSYLNEKLRIATWVRKFDGKLKAERRFQIKRVKDDKTLMRGRAQFICIDLESGKPRRVPDAFKQAYMPFMATPKKD